MSFIVTLFTLWDYFLVKDQGKLTDNKSPYGYFILLIDLQISFRPL